MSKFTDYESSFITPQKTLLSKFNYLLKYLRKNPTINVFEYNGILSNNYMQISDLNILEYDLELGDLIVDKNCNYAFVSTIGTDTFTVGTITSFKGAKGDKGDKGDQGEKGDKGDKGDGVILYGHFLEITGTNGESINLTLFTSSINQITSKDEIADFLPRNVNVTASGTYQNQYIVTGIRLDSAKTLYCYYFDSATVNSVIMEIQSITDKVVDYR